MADVKIAGVRKAYDGKEVVHGIDLEFDDGEFIVIVGPSGCGKSTLLRMIAGLEDITGGTIAIAGTVINDVDPVDRGCAMVFQNYALYPHMTVAENIGYPLRIARRPKVERLRKVQDTAATLGLEEYLDRRPAQLSGGQRQRVAMGRAIVREPRLFLFDEPLSNLDARLRVQMRVEIRRLHKKLRATSVFVTHDQVEAMTLADRLVVMNGGYVEQVGRPADVYAAPASTFVAGFLGAPPMNLFDASVIAPQRLALAGAAPFEIDMPGLALAEGSRVTLGARPEDLTLAPPDRPGLPAKVDLIEELGGSRVVYCFAGNAEVAVIAGREQGIAVNSPVAVAFDSERLHLFDSASGRRIDYDRPPPAVARLEIERRALAGG
ncbi:MAG: ABC transporter ATP-binding protein [Flavobacteriaceae bacterium]